MYGLVILVLMFATGIGTSVIGTLLSPVWFLDRVALTLVAPLRLTSTFTAGM